MAVIFLADVLADLLYSPRRLDIQQVVPRALKVIDGTLAVDNDALVGISPALH